MNKGFDIEELIRIRLTEAEVIPSGGTWIGIRRNLRWKEFLRFKPWQFNLYTFMGIILTGALVIGVLDNDTKEAEEVTTSSIYLTEQQYLHKNDNKSDPAPGSEQHRSREQINTELLPTKSAKLSDHDPAVTELIQDQQLNGGEVDKNESAEISTSDQSQKSLEISTPSLTRANFIPSAVSGCTPLEVTFYNHSRNAVKYAWFRNGILFSQEYEPTLLIETPGLHSISLLAENQEGTSDTSLYIIEVLPTPTAAFEFSDPTDTYDGNREVSLLNYSTGGIHYSWGIVGPGDNWSSNEFQPLLSSRIKGMENGEIRLIVTNEQGCSDIQRRKVPTGLLRAGPSLRFPTAFSPNETGSIGGSFSPQEKRTDIFHPVFVEEPMEYHLRIFTRRGELVFESDNIYIGWDGYYLQERSASDVYVWMVEGRWSDGQEFTLRGDVTLLQNGYR